MKGNVCLAFMQSHTNGYMSIKRVIAAEQFLFYTTCIFILYSLSGFQSPMDNTIKLVLFLVWLISALAVNSHELLCQFSSKRYLLLICFFSYVFIYVAFTTNIIFAAKKVLSFLLSISPIFIYTFLAKIKNSSILKGAVRIALFGLLYFSIQTLILLYKDPKAARIMAASTNIYQGTAVGGGYDLAYCLAALIPLFIFIFKRKIKLFNRLALVIYFIIYSICLVKSSYTIAILICLGLCALLLCIEKKSVKYNLPVVFIAVFCTFISWFYRDEIGRFIIEYISPVFSGTFVEARMRQLGELLASTAQPDNGALKRFGLYLRSIQVFFKYPVIGISFYTKFNYQNEIQIIGGHSSILDGFPQYGILFLLLIVFILKTFSSYKNSSRLKTNIITIYTGYYLLINTLNPCMTLFSVNFVFFFLFPYFLTATVDS